MGTSKSYGGPRDKRLLLPDWALPPLEPPEEDQDSLDAEGEDPANGSDPEPIETAPPPPRGSWTSAKTVLGRAIKGGGDRRQLKNAAMRYLRARGGPGQAARAAASGRSATARLGGFLADVASRGLGAALEALNLATVVGRDARTVFAAIANALAPDGATPEQVVAREAVDDVLSDLYERFVNDDVDLSRLDTLTEGDVSSAVIDSVTAYIYHRWIQELGVQLEKKAVTASEAVRLEREARLFVRDSVTLDLKGKNLLTMDWAREGNSLVEKIYIEAYTLFGAE